MRGIKYIVLTLGLIVFSLAVPVTVGAQNVLSDACPAGSTSVLCTQSQKKLEDYIKPIVNTLLFVLGAISVIMIILGGIKYTTSSGDTKNVESAKNTIMYAVIGLVVAILAGTIVNFVIGIF